MIRKLHEYEVGRRKRVFHLGILVGVVSICAATAIIYSLGKNVKEVIDEVKEKEDKPADPTEAGEQEAVAEAPEVQEVITETPKEPTEEEA